MLIALTMAFLLGGGSSEPIIGKPTRAAVKQEVTEAGRQEEVLATIKSLEKSRAEAVKASKKGPRKELDRLEADRAASSDDIAAEIDEIIGLRVGFQDDFIDSIFEMRDKMTEAEWRAVFDSGS